MCGRIAQTRSPYEYARAMGWAEDAVNALPDTPYADYNACPGARHGVIAAEANGIPRLLEVPWGYRSPWATKTGKPPAINARLDKLLGGYYRGLMTRGRVLVPADAWFEWTGEKGHKQPWYIHPKNGEPLFFAALSNYDPAEPDREGAGFVIVTDDSAGGMVDIHDRRPVALAIGDAYLWLDAQTPYDQAEHIARTTSLREYYFEWYPVSREVNSTRQHGAQLVEPITLSDETDKHQGA